MKGPGTLGSEASGGGGGVISSVSCYFPGWAVVGSRADACDVSLYCIKVVG